MATNRLLNKILYILVHSIYSKIFYYIFFFAFFCFVLFSLITVSKTVPYNPDEISWFFHTESFDELFIHHNTNKIFWESYESFDHPPVSKYIFGAYLYSKNYTDKDVLKKKYGRWDFYNKLDENNIKNTTFSNYINTMREINVFFIFGTLIFIFLLFQSFSKKLWAFSLLLIYFLLLNSLFINSMVRATSDAQYMCFALGAIFFYTKYLSTKKHFFIYIFAIFCSLAIATKLTAIVVFLAYFVYILLRIIKRRKKNVIIENIKELLIVSGIIYLLWILLNPTIYFSPLFHTLEYFNFRFRQTIILQNYFPDVALVDMTQRILAMYCTFFSSTCIDIYPKGQLTPFLLVNLSLFLIGLWFLISYKNPAKTLHFLFTIFLVSSLVIGGYLPLISDRYFLPLLVIIETIQVIGILSLIKKIYFFVESRNFLLNSFLT